jgi:hypothetical protein
MAVLCGIGSGVDYDCTSKRRVSGVKKVWLFNVGSLTSAITPSTGYITQLLFDGYDGLYLFNAGKFSHSATSTINVQAESGAVSFLQSVILRLFVDSPTELETLKDLLVAEVGAIVLTNNNEFRIYGAQNGMSATEGVVSPTGRAQGEDTATSVTLTGEEADAFRLLLLTDYQTTLNYVTALEV